MHVVHARPFFILNYGVLWRGVFAVSDVQIGMRGEQVECKRMMQ